MMRTPFRCPALHWTMRIVPVFLVVAAVLSAGHAPRAQQPAPLSLTFPGGQPELAAEGSRVYLAFGSGNSLTVARSDDGGRRFGQPTPLPVDGRVSLGMHRGPRTGVTAAAVLVSAVIGEKGGGADGDVRFFRSTDRGATWTHSIAINDVPGSAREGLHAMAAAPGGLVVVAWLDLRERGTRIYAAVSRDHGATWAPDVLAYASPSGSVCECCHPSIAIAGDGQIAIMFRNNVDGHRDMHVVRSSDGRSFGAATKLGTGSWALNGCPMDGGGLAFADGLTAVWRRENQVFLSTHAAPERGLGAGRDPAIAVTAGHRDVVFSGPEGIALLRNETPPVALGPGRFPSVLALAGRTVVAWEHGGAVHVRALAR
jgi:hypothetical protein